MLSLEFNCFHGRNIFALGLGKMWGHQQLGMTLRETCLQAEYHGYLTVLVVS